MSRTLEEILAYSRETGMDWALTADEAGLLRREVERQAAEIARLETQSENQARIIDTQRRLAQCGESKFEAENETLKEQLAEERAKLPCQEERFMWRHAAEKERADKAERELAEERENRIYVQQSGINAIARVAELQALVDAATTFRIGQIEVDQDPMFGTWRHHDGHGYTADDMTRDRAIALARDLAAKEKEPTR